MTPAPSEEEVSIRRRLMASKILMRSALVILAVGVFTATLAAQSVELYPSAEPRPFFTVNYGGGLKVMNVLGPIGFRADARGRTIPNLTSSDKPSIGPK